jgi:hypothetical protein
VESPRSEKGKHVRQPQLPNRAIAKGEREVGRGRISVLVGARPEVIPGLGTSRLLTHEISLVSHCRGYDYVSFLGPFGWRIKVRLFR